jgi:D-glycero-D-manno-heptose 1,7-bisphosphate phosphatase
MTLFIFDLDGTLISSYMENDNKEYNIWMPLPDRIAYLAHIRSRGHQVAIVTNQAGVAFGFVTEKQAQEKIAAALKALHLPADTPVHVCYADSRSRDPRYNDPAQVARRKPGSAMLVEAMMSAGVSAADAIYIGDRHEDKQAAAAAGVRYVDASEFFTRVLEYCEGKC